MKYLVYLYLAEVLVKLLAECLFSELSCSNISTEYQHSRPLYKLHSVAFMFCFESEETESRPTSLYYERYSSFLPQVAGRDFVRF